MHRGSYSPISLSGGNSVRQPLESDSQPQSNLASKSLSSLSPNCNLLCGINVTDK